MKEVQDQLSLSNRIYHKSIRKDNVRRKHIFEEPKPEILNTNHLNGSSVNAVEDVCVWKKENPIYEIKTIFVGQLSGIYFLITYSFIGWQEFIGSPTNFKRHASFTFFI